MKGCIVAGFETEREGANRKRYPMFMYILHSLRVTWKPPRLATSVPRRPTPEPGRRILRGSEEGEMDLRLLRVLRRQGNASARSFAPSSAQSRTKCLSV